LRARKGRRKKKKKKKKKMRCECGRKKKIGLKRVKKIRREREREGEEWVEEERKTNKRWRETNAEITKQVAWRKWWWRSNGKRKWAKVDVKKNRYFSDLKLGKSRGCEQDKRWGKHGRWFVKIEENGVQSSHQLPTISRGWGWKVKSVLERTSRGMRGGNDGAERGKKMVGGLAGPGQTKDYELRVKKGEQMIPVNKAPFV
jgi:hypothetical protein